MSNFGTAKTGTFMLGEATVMVGAYGANGGDSDLFKLNGPQHGLGLVKNFQLKYDTGYVNLTQGLQNNIVDSAMNKSELSCSFEVYEYSAKNIAYALGQNGSLLTNAAVATTVSTAETTGTYVSPDMSLSVTSATSLTAGSWIIVQGATQDQIYVDLIASVSTNVLTLTYGIPDSLPAGAIVRLAPPQALASTVDQPYLSMAAVGALRDGTLVRINIPKIKITKGFNLHFDTKSYGNMPFEATVYNPVQTDTYYSLFSAQAAQLVMA